MPRITTPEAREAHTENLLWSALSAWAGRRADRDGLTAGATHRVSLTVCGTIDDRWIERQVCGALTVNHDQSYASSVAPDYERLVALLLAEIPVRRRLRLAAELPPRLACDGELPAPSDAELLGIAAQLLKNLRQSKTATRRGSVRLEPPTTE